MQMDVIGDGFGILLASQQLDRGFIFEELGLAMDLEIVFDHFLRACIGDGLWIGFSDGMGMSGRRDEIRNGFWGILGAVGRRGRLMATYLAWNGHGLDGVAMGNVDSKDGRGVFLGRLWPV